MHTELWLHILHTGSSEVNSWSTLSLSNTIKPVALVVKHKIMITKYTQKLRYYSWNFSMKWVFYKVKGKHFHMRFKFFSPFRKNPVCNPGSWIILSILSICIYCHSLCWIEQIHNIVLFKRISRKREVPCFIASIFLIPLIANYW